MTKTITFNELRRIKDSLPDGSMHRIADELGVSVETVRNYFGGQNFQDGKSYYNFGTCRADFGRKPGICGTGSVKKAFDLKKS